MDAPDTTGASSAANRGTGLSRWWRNTVLARRILRPTQATYGDAPRASLT